MLYYSFTFIYISFITQMGACDPLLIIAPQHSLLSFCENDCHIQIHVMYILKISEHTLHIHTKTPSPITWRIPIAPVICLSIFIIGVMIIKDNTHSHFPNSIMFVSFNLLGGHCLYNLFLSSYPLLWGQN